ncbi:hypothetical protein IT408_01070 [Candidatus Uhrbacteria bacterium]|nr:hypothetical protein [Candidatus Uhrbacteria bacterium]
MNFDWFYPAFFGLTAVIVIFSVYRKIQMLRGLKTAIKTGDTSSIRASESENEVGLIIMIAVLYSFLGFWDASLGKVRTGDVAMYVIWWLACVRIFLTIFALSVIGLMGLRFMVKRKPESEFAKKFAVDAPKLKIIKNRLTLFSFFLVFFTIIGMVALVFLNPEVRALNGM